MNTGPDPGFTYSSKKRGICLQNLTWLFLFTMFVFSSCSKENHQEKYFNFQNSSWNRFNRLKFEFTINEKRKRYDVIFRLRIHRSCSLVGIPFNMVLNTPSGEERIREYFLQLRNKDGSFRGECRNDFCVYTMILKKDLFCSKEGKFRIEIENLNPRMETEGILAAGIVLEQK